MARVVRTAATRPGPKPPIQAVTMMAKKKMGATSASGCSRSATLSAAATVKKARPYLHTADDELCAELSDSVIPLTHSDKDRPRIREGCTRFLGFSSFTRSIYEWSFTASTDANWESSDRVNFPPAQNSPQTGVSKSKL